MVISGSHQELLWGVFHRRGIYLWPMAGGLVALGFWRDGERWHLLGCVECYPKARPC